MLSRSLLRQQRWVCASCLQKARGQQRSQSRLHAQAATAAAYADATPQPGPASFAADIESDDRTLRLVFDSQPFWHDFKRNLGSEVTGVKAGLFQNRYLSTPAGFEAYASATLQKCQALVSRILRASEPRDFQTMARDFDRLSDLLCRVIDLSDFVRATHPDVMFQRAATGAYTAMFEYMNQLNTTTGLNDQLRRATADSEITRHWTEEERTVAQILERDFSKSAIELPQDKRQGFVELSSRIADVGTEFVDGIRPEQSFLTFKPDDLRGMDAGLIRSMTSWGKVRVPTVGTAAAMALRTVEDDDVRRSIYMANRTASKKSIARLEEMLRARSQLAEVCGYPSYAHMALSDKMAKTPEAVDKFLQELLRDTRPTVNDEVNDLLGMKMGDARMTGFAARQINAWDRDYYTSRLLASLQTRVRTPDTLSAFFSLGSVFQGLSRLFHRLYGIRFVPRPPSPGEVWNQDVRRIDVVDDTEGHVAVMYCDLFSRPGKSPNPAHFTLRCSRAIDAAEIAEHASSLGPFSSAIEAATDGMAHSAPTRDGTVHQLPTIALICDFSLPSPSSTAAKKLKPALLSFRDVQTLFHEMGHALHSLLGRTALQNVSGTRCATDFAELPSVLMEEFAFDPSVLALWARHWDTDAPLPFGLVAERLQIERRMQGAETESQILLAFLDQALHNAPFGTRGADSTAVFHRVCESYAAVPEPMGTAWQGFFGHLYGYGATYYSYLFDRAIAGRVWRSVFGAGERALDRESGEKYKEEVLRWGGAREGWKCVGAVLGDARLEEGGEEAMKEVGRWGVGKN